MCVLFVRTVVSIILLNFCTIGSAHLKIDSAKTSQSFIRSVSPFSITLSTVEKAILHDFFFAMLSSSECGYVLYGNKPICFISLAAPGHDPVGTLGHRLSVDLNNGIQTWRALGLPQESPNFILHICDDANENQGDWIHLLLINRKAFNKVVTENISLFQYILGPYVTPDTLLKQLLDPKENFFSVLKDNKVLIGIVLGFGTNNAIHVSRLETIQEQLAKDSNLDTTLEPSFGYHSIHAEYQDIEKSICLSSNCLESEAPRLFFGCLPATEETKALIDHYEKTQLEIIIVLESPGFLETVLKTFFCNDQLVINNHPSEHYKKFSKIYLGKKNAEYVNNGNFCGLSQLAHRDWSRIVAHCIWQEFFSWSSAIDGQHSISKFIEGMEAANQRSDALYYAHLNKLNWFDLSNEELDYYKGFTIWSHFKAANKLYPINSVIRAIHDEQHSCRLTANEEKTIHQAVQKLHRHLYYLHQQQAIDRAKAQFSKVDPAHQIVKNQLYYKPLSRGEGKTIDANDRIKLRYSIKTLNYVLRNSSEEGEEIDLQRTIYGLRKGLVGLKEGASGTFYLHPKYGSRDTWHLPSIQPFTIIEFEVISII